MWQAPQLCAECSLLVEGEELPKCFSCLSSTLSIDSRQRGARGAALSWRRRARQSSLIVDRRPIIRPVLVTSHCVELYSRARVRIQAAHSHARCFPLRFTQNFDCAHCCQPALFLRWRRVSFCFRNHLPQTFLSRQYNRLIHVSFTCFLSVIDDRNGMYKSSWVCI